jgi:hypothetical protein
MEIPNLYRKNFENKPEQALRDLAGIPPAAGDPFISLTYKIDEAVERWEAKYEGLGSPVNDDPVRPQFESWFIAQDSLRRVMHLDIAYSAKGDALGLAMGHVSHLVEVDGEEKPFIVIDFMLRMKAAPGTEIMLQDARRYIYDVKEELGFRVMKVTMDGFQSTEMKQQLRKRRFTTDYLSVDKSKLPYEDLRDALYEDRIAIPPYFTYLSKGSTERIQIAVKELSELEDDDRKVDHPENGSKDVADCLAGVTNTLMGNRTYRRGMRNLTNEEDDVQQEQQANIWQVGGYTMVDDLQAPKPPSSLPSFPNGYTMPVPPSLMPRR